MSVTNDASVTAIDIAGPATGKYRELAELGAGGMGDVCVAVAQGPAGFSKLLVLKRLRPNLAEDPEMLSMFLREARLAAQLSHPNIVQTYEVGFDGLRYFIAMEYLDGQSLLAINRRNSPKFTLAMYLKVLAEALGGLHYAHELANIDGKQLGLVHRDATPHNIFVTYDGQIKVVDFGIAKAGEGDTSTGVLKGKVPYMAPEQAEGLDIDRRTDIFAVGVMLFEAVAKQRLWKGQTDMQVLYRLHEGDIPLLREVKPDVDAKLEAIVNRALAPKAQDRYATAAELQNDIEHYLEQTGQRVTTREIGRCVAENFDETRSRIRAVIDAQLRLMREAPPDAQSGVVRVPRLNPDATQSVSGQTPLGGTDTSSKTANVGGKKGWIGWLAPALLAVIASLVVISVREARRPAAQPASSNAAPVASAPAAPSPKVIAPTASATVAAAKAETVQFTFVVTPKEAKLFLDDAPLEANPYLSNLKRDGASHHLRAEAPGYMTQSAAVMFDQPTVTLHLTLVRGHGAAKPIVAAPTPTVTAAAPPPPPPQPEATQPKAKPSKIDKETPW